MHIQTPEMQRELAKLVTVNIDIRMMVDELQEIQRELFEVKDSDLTDLLAYLQQEEEFRPTAEKDGFLFRLKVLHYQITDTIQPVQGPIRKILQDLLQIIEKFI